MRVPSCVSSRSGFRIGAGGIRYSEGRSLVAAGVCLVAALVALVSLWGVVAAFSWHSWQVHLLWPALTALSFAAFALLMLAIALAPPQRLDFDATHRQVRGVVRRQFGVPRRIQLDFEALHSPELQLITQELGATLYQIRIGAARQAPMPLGALSERHEAQYRCDRLAELVAEDGAGSP